MRTHTRFSWHNSKFVPLSSRSYYFTNMSWIPMRVRAYPSIHWQLGCCLPRWLACPLSLPPTASDQGFGMKPTGACPFYQEFAVDNKAVKSEALVHHSTIVRQRVGRKPWQRALSMELCHSLLLSAKNMPVWTNHPHRLFGWLHTVTGIFFYQRLLITGSTSQNLEKVFLELHLPKSPNQYALYSSWGTLGDGVPKNNFPILCPKSSISHQPQPQFPAFKLVAKIIGLTSKRQHQSIPYQHRSFQYMFGYSNYPNCFTGWLALHQPLDTYFSTGKHW